MSPVQQYIYITYDLDTIEINIFFVVLYDKFLITERSDVDIACKNSNLDHDLLFYCSHTVSSQMHFEIKSLFFVYYFYLYITCNDDGLIYYPNKKLVLTFI